MSELTLTIVRLGLLVLLWLFVFSVAGALRGDLYGTRVQSSRERRRGSGSAPSGPLPLPNRRRSNVPGQLVVTDGSLRGTTLPLRGQDILIGRNPECALILDDDFASGRHARIFHETDGWFVEDLSSTNGTLVDGGRLTTAVPMPIGTELRIGRTTIEARR